MTTKALETTRIYLGTTTLPPRVALLNWAIAMKLGEFRKVPPEVIKHEKRHLDRTHSSGFTRRSILAYSYGLAIRP